MKNCIYYVPETSAGVLMNPPDQKKNLKRRPWMNRNHWRRLGDRRKRQSWLNDPDLKIKFEWR